MLAELVCKKPGRVGRISGVLNKPSKPTVGVAFLDLSEILLQGLGITRFLADDNNYFTLHHAFLLANGVHVSFTDNQAETVSIRNVTPGCVEVAYRVHNLNLSKLLISITIADVLLSQHSALVMLSPVAALQYFTASRRLSEVNSYWLDVLADHGSSAKVLLAVIEYLRSVHKSFFMIYENPTATTAVVAAIRAANRYHLEDGTVQERMLNMLVCLNYTGRLTVDVLNGVFDSVYAALDAHPTHEVVQEWGCRLISSIAWASAKHQILLLQGRAEYVCERAKFIVPQIADNALKSLNRCQK